MARKNALKLETLLTRVRLLAALRGATMFEILIRNAGWGISWHEEEREKNPPQYARRYDGKDAWRNGLVVYRYYPSLRQALRAEEKRLRALP